MAPRSRDADPRHLAAPAVSAFPLELGPVLLAPLLLGVVILRALGLAWRDDRLGFLGWAYALGCVPVAAVTLGWLAVGRPFAGALLAPALCVAGALSAVRLRRRPGLPPAPPPAPRVSAPVAKGRVAEEWAFRGVLAAVLVLVVVRCLALDGAPVGYGDEAEIWASKAKALFAAERLDERFALRASLFVQHADYPLLNPLLQVGVFAAVDGITHVANRIPVQVFALALAAAAASALRRRVRPGVAALLLLAFFGQGTLLQYLGAVEADLMLAVGILIAGDAWLRWAETRDVRWWRLAATALALVVWSKNEGAMLALVLGIAVVVASPRRIAPATRALWWLAAPVLLLALTKALNAHFGFANDLFDTTKSGLTLPQRLSANFGDRAGTVVGWFTTEELLSARSRGLCAFAVALGAIHTRRLVPTRALVPLLAMLGALAVYALIFVATPHDLPWHLATAARRTVFHTTPFALLAIATVVPPGWPLRAASSDARRTSPTPTT
jgi:hypothetical protein